MHILAMSFYCIYKSRIFATKIYIDINYLCIFFFLINGNDTLALDKKNFIFT